MRLYEVDILVEHYDRPFGENTTAFRLFVAATGGGEASSLARREVRLQTVEQHVKSLQVVHIQQVEMPGIPTVLLCQRDAA